ncbi:hypothetical protein J437_LFUL001414 [Ladona fulva]|uniref:Uncharacterized protein n=1 Tax=Ladona fulva TaxID=123851 RepID=A0A8K0NUB3_LADFU|nr:hypothetical protein J437_LFUL001414 [Ladona fulva]
MQSNREKVTKDKVKQLQELVRNLQLPNRQQIDNGSPKKETNVILDKDVELEKVKDDYSTDIIFLEKIDFSDEQTWLYVPEKESYSGNPIEEDYAEEQK